ncbi:MAG: YceI family protein [Gemmatimonadales bacterium]
MTGRWTRLTILMVLTPGLAIAQAQSRVPRKRSATALPTATLASTPVHFALAPAGNEARFIVREQLTIFESPNDAVGVTRAITGGITLAPDGQIDASTSKIVVDLSTLTTDKKNRDKWIKTHTLQTDSFPNAVFIPRRLQGVGTPLPSTGNASATLLGDMTLHGVTQPVTWDVTLTGHGDEYSGTATTHIKFEDFGMDQPRLMIVVSVVDDIKLQYDFHFVRSGPK